MDFKSGLSDCELADVDPDSEAGIATGEFASTVARKERCRVSSARFLA